MSEKLVSFAKLNASNYENWSFKMKLLLIKDTCWDAVDKAVPVPVTPAWESKNQLAMATIGLAVEDSQLIHIRKAKTANEAWDNLEKVHVKRTLSTKVSLMRKICRLRLAPNGDMEGHIATLSDLVEKLNGLQTNAVLDDQWLVAIMFSSLPEEYETLVTALEARPDADLTLDLVKGKLIDEWLKKVNRTDGANSDETALHTAAGRDSDKCYFCKKPGHKKANCEKWKKWKENKQKSEEKSGHKANSVMKNDDESVDWAFVTGDLSVSDVWILDSGATCHISNNRDFFELFDSSVREDITVANGAKVRSTGRGSGKLISVDNANKRRVITVDDVLLVPDMKANLLSVKRLVNKGFVINFDAKGATISRNGTVGAVAELVNNLFVLKRNNESVSMVAEPTECIHGWHRKLGHRDSDAVKKLSSLVTGIKFKDCNCSEECEVCIRGKMHRVSFPKASTSKSLGVMDLVHTDLCGPMRTATLSGRRYFLTFVDDFSKYTVVYILKRKSETLDKLREYVEMVNTKFGKKPKILRSDNGGEYTGKNFRRFLKDNGIVGQLTAPYSPQQNGTAERKNRYLVEMARCMLIEAGLDDRFWGEAITTANYLQNRLPTRTIPVTPYERWHGVKPNLNHIYPFGVDVFCYIPGEKRGKLDEKAKKLKLMGYSEVSKAYRLIDVSTGRITVSRDVKFLSSFSSVKESGCQPSCSEVVIPLSAKQQPLFELCEEPVMDPDEEDVFEDAELDEESDAEEEVLRRSTRTTKGQLPARYACSAETGIQEEPKTLKEALYGPDADNWKKAMLEELDSINSNGTWDLVDVPPGKRVLGSKWIYKIKRTDDNAARFKARLVAQGYNQQYGDEYDEVFAPVVRQTTFRALMSVAAKRKMIVRQYDIKTAFLNGDLEEELFMRQPPGFVVKGAEGKVCRLKRSLYGLKQSARSWNIKLHQVLEGDGFNRSDADPCLYSKQVNGKRCYILVYVDDLVIASEDQALIASINRTLERNFEVVSLGEVRNYVGIEVERDIAGDFHISQRKYIADVVKSAGLQDAKPSAIPIDVGYFKSDIEDTPLPDNAEYQKLVGKLLFIAVNSRPDIAAPVSILSRKLSNPSQRDWIELKRIVRYLKGSINLKLRLSKHGDESGLVGHADADWAECRTDRKSNSGFLFKFCDGTISWACRKQTCVSLSTAEAEFVALSEASQEAIWLQRLLQDLGEDIGIVQLNEDNQSCLKMLQSDKFSNKTKHIDTKYNFVKHLCQNGTIKYVYCPSEFMTADLLTKPVARIRVEQLRRLSGLEECRC